MKDSEVKVGNIYWLKTENDISHPHVVIKIEDDNVTLCEITTNVKKINMPGTVILDLNEGNLEKQSFVEVYKTYVAKKDELKELIGTLSEQRVMEILKGIQFIKNTYLN